MRKRLEITENKLFCVVLQIVLVCLAITLVAAKPKPLELVSPVAYTAPVVTASSSQVFARNYNGFAAPLVAAPAVTAAYTAPVAYSAYSSYTPLAYSSYAYTYPYVY